MMTFEELNRGLELRRLIESEGRKLADLRACSSALTANITETPKAQPQTAATETLAIKIVEAEKTLRALQIELLDVSTRLAQRLCNELQGGLQLSVMLRHYVAGFSFTRIGIEMNFTKEYISKLHNRALRRLTGTNRQERRRAS